MNDAWKVKKKTKKWDMIQAKVQCLKEEGWRSGVGNFDHREPGQGNTYQSGRSHGLNFYFCFFSATITAWHQKHAQVGNEGGLAVQVMQKKEAHLSTRLHSAKKDTDRVMADMDLEQKREREKKISDIC